MTTPGPIAVGSRRRATVRGIAGRTTENEIEVTDLEPGRRLAVPSVEAPLPFTSSWTFTSVDAGTRVDWVWDFTMPRWLGLFDKVVGALFARSFRPDLARLKSMMESGEI